MEPLEISAEDPGRALTGDLLATAEHASIAHEPAVIAAVARAYRLRAYVLVARRGGEVEGLLPAVRVRGPLGTVLASTAYLDGGGPIGTEEARSALVAALAREAARSGAVLELRSASPVAPPDGLATTVVRDKVTLVRRLEGDPAEIARRLDAKTRNQLRKALREGLSAETVPATPEALASFHGVYARTLRDLGSPSHSLDFFSRIARALPGRAHVARVVSAPGALLAAALVLDDRRDGSVLPWAASDRRADALEPNTLLYHELLRGAVGRGRARFDFGRSTVGSAQHRFKERWGAEPVPLHWTTIGRRETAPVSRDERLLGVRALWRHVPVAVSTVLGARLLRWLPA